MNKEMSDAWDLLDAADTQQWDAAFALRTSPDLDPEYMMDTLDVAFEEFSKLSRLGFYMILARMTLYDV